MRLHRFVCAMLLAVVLPVGILPSNVHAETKPAKISPKRLTQRVTEPDVRVHYGNLSVPADSTLHGPLAVLEGSLDLAAGSRFDGLLWIVNGDLILGGDAAVSGTVQIVDGELFQARDARIEGQVRRYRCTCQLDRDLYQDDKRIQFVKRDDPRALDPEIMAGIGPTNRVDFSSALLGVKRGNPLLNHPHTRGHAYVIAPFRNNTRGYLGFDAELLIPVFGRRGDLEVAGFKKTVTNDDWQFRVGENAFALDLTHNDFLDYYERTAARVGIRYHVTRSLTAAAHVYVDHSQSLETRTVPSLGRNGVPLRSNPAIDDGEILGGTLSLEYDTRQFPSRPTNAWFLSGTVEQGIDAGPGDFEFATLTLDARRYNRPIRGLNVDCRGRLFTTWDQLPRQRWQSLNGYGGIRGLHDIPFDMRRGDRLALFSAEVRVDMPPAPLLKIFFTRWNIMAFADAGILDHYGDALGSLEFLKAKWRDWGKSVGFGISGESFLPYVGLYVAQDLDRDNKRPRFIIRAERSF